MQDAIVQLSALGRIVSQQVTIDDLQATLDTLERRERSVRAQIALVTARLESEALDATTRAQLEARLRTLRSELRQLRRDTASTSAEARMATIQVSVVTPGVLGAVPVPSRLDRTLDEAVNILVWEGVVALAIAIVAAPFALIIAATWIGRSLYRRREEEKLLAIVMPWGLASARPRFVDRKRRDQRLGDHLQRPPRDLARLPQPRKRFRLAQPLALHEHPLRPLDRLARRERLGQRIRLLPQRRKLLVPGARGLDRRQEVGLAERLHEVAEDARLDRARYELPLPVRGHHHDRDRALFQDPAGRFDPVEAAAS